MPVLKGNGGDDAARPAGTGRHAPPRLPVEHILHMDLIGVVVLAERAMRVDDVVNLRPGSIIEFPKSAEGLLDFQVNTRTIARGITVKDGEKFGLEIREIGRVQDTVRALGQ